MSIEMSSENKEYKYEEKVVTAAPSSSEVVCDKCQAVLSNASLLSQHNAEVHNFVEKKEGVAAATSGTTSGTTTTTATTKTATK